VIQAHSAGPGHTVEAELLAFGVALLFLAVMLRPSRSGRRQEFLVALIAGALLIAAAFVTPRL
jgi:hypothetical protein